MDPEINHDAEEAPPGDALPELYIDAVVQDGVIRPLTPLQLPEGTTVQLRVRARASAIIAVTPTAERAPMSPHSASTTAGAQSRRPGIGRWPSALAALRARLAPRLATARPVLLITALGFTLFGQLAFHRELAFTTGGFILALIGGLLAVVAFLDTELAGAPASPPVARSQAVPMISAPRLMLLVLAIWGMMGLLYALQVTPALPNYLWTLPVWLLLIGLYCAATLPVPQFQLPFKPPQLSKLAWVGLGIVGLALVARGWQGGVLPATLSGDEGRFGVETMRVLTGEINNPFSTGWLSVPTLTFFYNAPTVAIFGNTLLGLRLPWILMGTMNILIVFWLINRLQGPVVGIVAAVLLALYHYHIHFSRLGLNNIADPFFVSLALLLLYRAYDRKSSVDWVLCGIVTGVSQYFYFGARFVAIVVVASIACLALQNWRSFWREHGRGLLLGLGAALIAAGPIIQYAFRYPDIYNARLNQTGVLQSGWLEAAVADRSESAAIVMLDQFKRATLAFNAYPDTTPWYGLPGPLLDLAAGTLFILGLAIASSRLFNPRIFPMVAWWGGAILLAGTLTENPPASQRLITTSIPAIFFVALALVLITQTFVSAIVRPQRVKGTSSVVLSLSVIALSISSLKTYFVDYTPQRIYASYNGIISTEIGHYAARELGPDWRIYFLAWPVMSFDFGSNLYLAPATEGIDIADSEGDTNHLRVAESDKNAAFIVLPFREAELTQLQEIYPGGALERIPSPIGPEALFFVYRVPRSQLSATNP